MMDRAIVILAAKGDTTTFLYNEVKRRYPSCVLILETPVSKIHLLKRRVKNLGLAKVIGQLLFLVLWVPLLKVKSKIRIEEIIKSYGLDSKEIPEEAIISVESVNNEKTAEILKRINPNLVLINGTRIISKSTLASVSCSWINIHAGITPKYRGVHGGYWALVNEEPHLCGVTVHFVDRGIDTGSIIDQSLIPFTSKDNFCTYPYLQFAIGLDKLLQCIPSYLNGSLKVKASLVKTSQLWYHPTIWDYFYSYIRKGVR